jgi:S-adenosylmethionine decarboxylase proenzyme
MQYNFYGTHYVASYLDCDYNALVNINELRQNVKLAILECGATIIDSSEKIFENNGFTILFLLSESHCSIHTYPEHNSIFTDLFTCGTNCSYEKYEEIMKKYLKPTKIVKDIIQRGQTNDLVKFMK